MVAWSRGDLGIRTSGQEHTGPMGELGLYHTAQISRGDADRRVCSSHPALGGAVARDGDMDVGASRPHLDDWAPNGQLVDTLLWLGTATALSRVPPDATCYAVTDSMPADRHAWIERGKGTRRSGVRRRRRAAASSIYWSCTPGRILPNSCILVGSYSEYQIRAFWQDPAKVVRGLPPRLLAG